MGLSQRATVLEQDIHQISSVQQGALGLIGETKDGRQFKYGLAGAADLAVGKLAMQAAPVANHQKAAVAGSAGDTKVTFTNGATDINQDDYKDGYLVGYSGTGAGQTVRIRTHGKIVASTAGTIYLAEPLTTTFASTPLATLVHNPYWKQVIADHTATTNKVTGVPIITVTTAFYAWFQTKGVAAVLTNGTPAAGAGAILSATTDGALDVEGTSAVTERLGVFTDLTSVSTKYNAVYLDIK